MVVSEYEDGSGGGGEEDRHEEGNRSGMKLIIKMVKGLPGRRW